MSFEEEFDSIIRRKAEEEKYPFDESNWEKTSSFLDAERKATRALKIKQLYLPAALIVALGTAGFIAFNHFNPDHTDAAKAVATSDVTKEISLNNNSIKNINDKTLLSSNKNTSENTTSNSENAVVNSSAIIPALSPESESVKVSETSGLSKNTGNLVTPFAEKETASTKKGITTAKSENSSVTTTRPQEKNNTTGSTSAEPVAVSSISINESNAANKDRHVNENNPVDTQTPANTVSSNNGDIQNASTQEDVVSTQNNESGNKLSAASVVPFELNSAEEVTLYAEQLNAVYSMLPFEVIESDLMPTPFTVLSRYDDDYFKNKKTPKTHYMNVELGGNYLLGWNAQNGKDGKGLNWFAGVNYGRYLSRKISISLGLQAYNIAHITQPFYFATSKEYGFGSKNIYTRVTSNQLYYIAVPLKFNYAVNSTNVIGFGVNAGYLVSANNTISKYYLLDNEEKTIGSLSSHSRGIYKGTNLMNVMLSAHYKTQFGKRIGLNLEFNYGLNDIFGNMSQIKTSEKPVGIRLGLTYTLFDK